MQQLLQPSVKHRNFYLQMANELVKEIKIDSYQDKSFENGYGVLDKLRYCAGKYREETYDKAVILKHKTKDKLLVLPYYTRFSVEYYNQICQMIDSLDIDEGIHLTLTLDPKNFGCLYDAHRALMKGWNKLKTAILKGSKSRKNKKYYHDGWKGDYLAVVEFQEKSTKLPHLHVLMIGCKRLDVEAVRELWSKYKNGHMFRVVPVKRELRISAKTGHEYLYKPAKYLLKYMQKYTDNMDHLTELWALNARAYSMSQGLFEKYSKLSMFSKQNEYLQLLELFLKSILGSQWQFFGVYPLSDVQSFTKYEDLVHYLT